MSATDRVMGVALGHDVLVSAEGGRRMPLAFESGANGARESLDRKSTRLNSSH